MIFIPGNVPSSKNSRITNRSTGRSFPSKKSQQFIKESKSDFDASKEEFLEMLKGKSKPYLIGFHFVRDSRRRWDFHNMVQLPLDLMTKNGWIDDDNTTEVLPIPMQIDGKYESLDKDKPGVYISVL